MTKRVVLDEISDLQIKKAKELDALPTIISQIPSEIHDNDGLFWQFYLGLPNLEQLEKVNAEEGKSPREKKRVQWTGFYRRKTEDYDIEVPLEYHRIKVLKSTPQKLTLSAVQKENEAVYIIRRVSSVDPTRIQSLFRTLMLHKLIPTENVMRPCEMYIRDGYIYTIAESMESQLREIVEDPSTHFCVSRIIHQLLLLLDKMHKFGIIHGNITTSSIYIDMDLKMKVANFGNFTAIKQDFKATRQDVIAVRSILAKLLLVDQGSESDQKVEENDEELDWKCLMESPSSGLTDENARDLLDAMFENKFSCEQLLKHKYFKSFRATSAFEPEGSQLEKLEEKTKFDEFLNAAHSATATVSIS